MKRRYLQAFILYCLCGDAMAYLDPGTGSILLQFFIGAIVLVVYGLKNKIQGLAGLLKKNKDDTAKKEAK